MNYFKRILAKAAAKGCKARISQSSSPTSFNKASQGSTAKLDRPQTVAGHSVGYSTLATKESFSRLNRLNIFINQMDDYPLLSSPKNSQDDVYMAHKIEKALALFSNAAWSPGHPQNNTLYNFIYDMAQHLLMIPTHLGLPLCESLVEDALVCLEDHSDSDSDAYEICMGEDLEEISVISVILHELSTYAKRLA